jgi:hypothetical protein
MNGYDVDWNFSVKRRCSGTPITASTLFPVFLV